MKYEVKNRHGQLTFGSLRELVVLYQREFVSDGDLVRRHGTERWIRAGDMAELQGSRERVADHTQRVWLVIGLVCLVSFCAAAVKLRLATAMLVVIAVVVFAIAAGVAWRLARGRTREDPAALASPDADKATSARFDDEGRHGQGHDPR